VYFESEIYLNIADEGFLRRSTAEHPRTVELLEFAGWEKNAHVTQIFLVLQFNISVQLLRYRDIMVLKTKTLIN
jgi:hypothetical protein